MRAMRRAFLVELVFLLPCAAGSFPDYPVRPLSDYPNSVAKSGLMIAVHPLDSVKEQQTYFGAKLTPKGYLPVLIVMQNASKEDSFLVKKSVIAYSLPGAAGSVTSTPKTPSKGGEAVVAAEMATLVPTLPAAALADAFGGSSQLVFLPLDLEHLAGLKLFSNNSQIQQNLVKKAFQSTTLSPAASAQGFFYVPVPKASARQTIHLRIPVTRSGSDDPLDFDLEF